MRIIIKKPGEEPELVDREGDALKVAQQAVGGLVEVCYERDSFLILCDEEGLLKNLPFHMHMGYSHVHGPICVVGLTRDEDGSRTWTGLSEEDSIALMARLREIHLRETA